MGAAPAPTAHPKHSYQQLVYQQPHSYAPANNTVIVLWFVEHLLP